MDNIPIWGNQIPGNSTRSKLEDMDIKGTPNVVLQTLRFVKALPGKRYKDKKKTMDTFTYVSCIMRGHARETYEDIPYLIPYFAKGSDSAVIIIPGGGYGYLSIDITHEDEQTEGALVARQLNKAGVSAFVLAYRYNPYRMPLPLLDVQRAVRFLRFNAVEYGLDARKIGLVGFSAGGYQVGGFLNLVCEKCLFPQDYQPDTVDATDDKVNHAAMFYPLLTLRYNVPAMTCAFPKQMLCDAQKRENLIEAYELSRHLSVMGPQQFIAHGSRDILVNVKGVRDYVEALKRAGIPHCYIEVHGANHGFTGRDKYAYVREEYLEWCKKQFKM